MFFGSAIIRLDIGAMLVFDSTVLIQSLSLLVRHGRGVIECSLSSGEKNDECWDVQFETISTDYVICINK